MRKLSQTNLPAIYIANLGKYNEGHLVGEWINLPFEQEELNELFVRIKLGTMDDDGNYTHGYVEQWERNGVMYDTVYEEYAIHDYEHCPFEVSEYSSLSELNEMAELLQGLDDDDMEIVKIMHDGGYYGSFEDAVNGFRDGDARIYHDCKDMTDVAYQLIEETDMLHGVPDNIARYFDYESFGRDLDIEGNYHRLNWNTYIEIVR